MNSYTQLFLLIFSYIYGMLLYHMNIFNNKIFNGKNIIVRLIGCILYINVMSLIYVLVLYKLCYGELHYYFIFLMIVGYGIECVKKCK